MADDDEEREGGDEGSGSGDGGGRRRPLREIVSGAREQLAEMTGRQVSSVLGVEREEDGWVVTAEVVELRRVPETTSIMGCYRVSLDSDGELVDYRRIRRYHRSQPDSDG